MRIIGLMRSNQSKVLNCFSMYLCFYYWHTEPKVKKMSEMPRFTNRAMIAIIVYDLVCFASSGCNARATMTPKKLAVTLMRPQLIVSPTPSAAVDSTASS